MEESSRNSSFRTPSRNNHFRRRNTTQFLPAASAASSSTQWTGEEKEIVETALAMIPDGTPDRWEMIAHLIPGRSVEEVREHGLALIFNVNTVESNRVALPNYMDGNFIPTGAVGQQVASEESRRREDKGNARKRKWRAWTRREHELFLVGLRRFGKGAWKKISQYVVVSKTPAQVASHAYNFFLRQESRKMKQESRKKKSERSSINDITDVNDNLPLAVDNQTHSNQFDSSPISLQSLAQPLPSSMHPQQFDSTVVSLPDYQSFHHPRI